MRLAMSARRRRIAELRKEETMAKGQLRKPKEAKKPKADKPKGGVSAYKQSQAKAGATSPAEKKV